MQLHLPDWQRPSRSLGSNALALFVAVAMAVPETAAAPPPPAAPARAEAISLSLIQRGQSRENAGYLQVELRSEDARRLVAEPMPARVRVPLPDRESVELEIAPFHVTTDRTLFAVGTPTGDAAVPTPQVATYRGHVAGEPGSVAYLAVAEHGLVNGSLRVPGVGNYVLSSGRRGSGTLTVQSQAGALDLPEFSSFCGLDPTTMDRRIVAAPRGSPETNRGPRLLRVAIEGDQEYTQLFDTVGDANAYIVQLVAAISDIYIRDLNTKLVIDRVRLWPMGGEPFGADDIEQFLLYYVDIEDTTGLNIVHMLSGRRDLGYGGIGYVGGTCFEGATYSISGLLLGSFPNPVNGTSIGNWDLIVAAHEMGHNCGTFHTHDGYSPTIDDCGNGVPSRGTIMSYCHTFPGGTTNTDLRFHRRVQDVIEGELLSGGCFPFDCNDNGTADSQDIAAMTSADVNGNAVPDECEDCNTNGTLDPQDIINGAPDSNGNGIPDACEPDCDADSAPDPDECDASPSIDQDGNNVPDTCDPDCDGNGTADHIDLRNGVYPDVQRDTVPDICQNCDANGISDWIDLGRGHNLYVCERADYVREYFSTSGYPIQNLGVGSISDAYDCVFGSDNQLYVASFGNDRIVRIDVDAGTASTFVAAGSGGLDGPASLVFGSDGNLYVASQVNSRVLEYDGQTGAFLATFVTAGLGGLASPYGLTFGPDGHLYVTSGNAVLRYDGSTGASLGAFVTSGSGGLSSARGLAFLPNGNLVVASFNNSRLQEHNGSTGAFIRIFNNGPTLSSPWGVRMGPNGSLYAVRSASSPRVMEYNADTGWYQRSFVRADGPLPTPTGLDFRRVFANDCNANRVPDVCDPESTDVDLFVAQLLADPQDPVLKCMYDRTGDGDLDAADVQAMVEAVLP